MNDNAEYNAEVKNWGNKTMMDIKSDADRLNIQHRANSPSPNNSITALKVKFGSVDGMIKRVAFRIRRHLIFVHKGVGKGTPISNVGNTNRKAKPFINDPVDNNINNLADIVAEHTGDEVISRIKIN